jgi:hypothetical protein
VIQAHKRAVNSVSFSPDGRLLELEYEQALRTSARTSQSAKSLIVKILAAGDLVGFFGFDAGPFLGFDQGVWAGEDQCDVIASIKSKANARCLPRKRTDAHLVALARDAIVITANANEAHWMRSPKGTGKVIQWNDLEKVLQQWPNLATAMRYLLSAKHSSGAISSARP